MSRKLINWLGLTGILSFISYTAAVVCSPIAYPGYNWMEQAVSDLSAEDAPSRRLWNQLSAFYGIGSTICMTCVSIFISETEIGTKPFRVGIYLFAIMTLVSNTGYQMFPLSHNGKEIRSFQEVMHIIVTMITVLLSILSLVLLIISGLRDGQMRGISIWALISLMMMLIGAIGTGVVPSKYFGIVERFSVFAAVAFNSVLGLYLFWGFKITATDKEKRR